MLISELSVKRPIFATVINLLILVIGIAAFQKLPLREYPDIDPPIVTVDTNYPGSSAAIVDSKVTELIENSISGIEGIRSIDSQSQDGRSRIVIEFELSRDIDSASNDVRDRVSRIVSRLPEEADPPRIFKVDSNTDVIMWLNLVSDNMDQLELTDFARRSIVDRLSTINGVAQIRVGGQREYSMRVWIQREALAARALTINDVEDALRRENVELPAGRLESEERFFTVRLERAYNTVEDFKQLVIEEGSDGHIIRLADVAEVEIGPLEHRQEMRSNGVNQVGLGIIPQSTANTLEIAEGVKKEVIEIQKLLPEGTRLFNSFDSTVFIDEAIKEIYFSLSVAAGLVVLVIFIFLGSIRAVLIPALTVPISLIGSLMVLQALGFSLNLLTLLALLLAIGLVVDDAIVVLENIYRRVELGETPSLAAVRGSRQVGFAVVATTLVLVAVFTPIAFLQGNTGRLFSEFAFAMAAAVCFSSLVALTLSPMMCSFLLSKGMQSAKIGSWVNRLFHKIARGYRILLQHTLVRPGWLLMTFVIVVGSIYILNKNIESEFAPKEDRGVFFVIMRGPQGASYEYSQRYMHKIENILMPLRDSGEASRVLVRTPMFGSAESYNSGIGIVVLNHWQERERSTGQIVGQIGGQLRTLPGVMAFPVMRSGLSRRAQEPIQFVIGGNTYEELIEWQTIILEKARENPNLVNVDSDLKETKPQFKVVIDRDRAADLGVPVENIGRTLETMMGSRKVTTFIDRGEEYDVVLQSDETERQSPSDLSNIYVRSDRSDALIPLSNLVSLKEVADAPELNRFNRLRAVTIKANLTPGYTIGQALAFLEETVQNELGSVSSIDYKGESREYVETQGAIFFVFLFALVIVYLVLSAQFESFIHPITILMSVPLALAGALVGLYLTDSTLNIFSQIGIVMLIGLAAKNGILIVEFANQLRDQGKPLEEALLTAAELRFRPIVMTAISTVFGALPLVLADGAGAESRFAIGMVVFSGVLISSALTLFVVPYCYLLLARFTGSPLARTKKIDAEAKAIAFAE